MIEIESFYKAAGLLPPEIWESQRLNLLKEDLFDKIPLFLSGKEVSIPDINRGSGKTTKILIEALQSEWYGYNTVIVFDTAVDVYFAKSRINHYRKNILSKIGPPLTAGIVSLITKTFASQHSNSKVVWDLNT